MLHICKPYPEPTLFDLMETANNLKAIDKAHVGFVTKEDFMKVCISLKGEAEGW